MKIYLAALFSEQKLMREWRRIIQSRGHLVTARWLDHSESMDEADARTKANVDLYDIEIAEVMISATLSRGAMFTGGGRHVEFGYAYARGKRLINIGGRENIFHFLPGVVTVKTIEEAVDLLPTMEDGIELL